MSNYAVTMNLLGQFTVRTAAEDQTEAYDKAVDAFFDALDKAGIEYDVERRTLEDVSEEEPSVGQGPT